MPVTEFAYGIICEKGKKKTTEGGPERRELSWVLRGLRMALRV